MAKIEGAVARLGHAVESRRRELGLSQIDVWQNGGPSNSTLTRIENGEGDSPNAATLRKLDKALEWEPGSAAAVLVGDEPRVRGAQMELPGSFTTNAGEYVVTTTRTRKGPISRPISPRLALALALAADAAEEAGDTLDSITWDETEPEGFDFGELEAAQSEVSSAINQLAALAAEIAERTYGGRAQLEIAKEREHDQRRWRRQLVMRYAGDTWPDGAPVAEHELIAYAAWQRAGMPAQWELYRSEAQAQHIGEQRRDAAQAQQPAEEFRKVDALQGERRSDYDLVGGSAARTVPGPTDAEKRHAVQDAAAEAPDEDGPDAGA